MTPSATSTAPAPAPAPSATATVPGGRSFADLSVMLKILMAVTVAALVALIVGSTGLAALSTASESAQTIYHDNVSSVDTIGRIGRTVTQTRVDLANEVLSTDVASRAKFAQGVEADLATFNAAMNTYREGSPAGAANTIADLQTTWTAYTKVLHEQMLPAGARHDTETWTNVRDTQTLPLLKQIYADVDALTAAERASAAKNAAVAKSGYQSSRRLSLVLLIGGLLSAIALGVVVARKIVHSLAKVTDVCAALAAGDLTHTVGLTSRDEPGQMGRALDSATSKLREMVSTIDGSAASLASVTEQMTGTATQIAASAEEASAQAQTVSAAAEQVSRSVETVSAGSQQMGASIREISQNASEAARVAAEAVSVTAATSTTMARLGESSAEIGNVIKVITSIAEQTNLLALNATIEAARAGDMGKGFAVVASEVKDLAQETAKATEDISRRVEAIQADTGGAVAAIEGISAVIARISEFQTTIASAVEQQTATTAEMNRSVSEAASGTGEIARNITGVAEAARLTSRGVTETQQVTAEMARMSAQLSALVAAFRF
jgi:methyl-accepting chemotaxis protein